MVSQVTNYQCPACTGPLNFDPETGKMSCDFCGSSFELAEIEAQYTQKEKAAAEAFAEAEETQELSGSGEDWGTDADGMKSYSCPSCLAELICDETTAATACPYCGNPTVVPGQFSGSLKPDFVLPFKLEKEAAVAALKKHYGKRFFLPKTFKDENHLEKVQGVYVPFWLFDAKAQGEAAYEATKSRRFRRGDYEITETSHFSVTRAGNMAFEKIPVDASKKMPDGHMDSIEPFDYSELKPFSTAYLPGFLADKFDVTAEESKDRAEERCEGTLEDELRGTVTGYETVALREKDFTVQRGKTYYALLPVWLLDTKWRGKDFLFAMNGQTGKLVGDLPVDKKKYWLTFFGIGLVLSILSLLLFADAGYVLPIAVSFLIALIVVSILKAGMKNVEMKAEAAELVSRELILTSRTDRYTHTTTARRKIETSSAPKAGSGRP